MINMFGHVSPPFVTHPACPLNRYSSQIVDYEPVFSLIYSDTFDANIQPLNDREIEFLQIGAERINDFRVVHRNDGLGIQISTDDKLADILLFSPYPGVEDATWWKSINTDYRPWHNFCRALVVRLDPDEIAQIEAAVQP